MGKLLITVFRGVAQLVEHAAAYPRCRVSPWHRTKTSRPLHNERTKGEERLPERCPLNRGSCAPGGHEMIRAGTVLSHCRAHGADRCVMHILRPGARGALVVAGAAPSDHRCAAPTGRRRGVLRDLASPAGAVVAGRTDVAALREKRTIGGGCEARQARKLLSEAAVAFDADAIAGGNPAKIRTRLLLRLAGAPAPRPRGLRQGRIRIGRFGVSRSELRATPWLTR